jgi:hypothetical protein
MFRPCLVVPRDGRKWTNKKAHNRSDTVKITARLLTSYVNLLWNAAPPKARQEILDLAARYERKGDHFDLRATD